MYYKAEFQVFIYKKSNVTCIYKRYFLNICVSILSTKILLNYCIAEVAGTFSHWFKIKITSVLGLKFSRVVVKTAWTRPYTPQYTNKNLF